MADPQPPQLPPGAPADLRGFVACTGATWVLRSGTKLDWLPLDPGVKEYAPEPTITLEPGAQPGTVQIRVGLGDFLSLTLPASCRSSPRRHSSRPSRRPRPCLPLRYP